MKIKEEIFEIEKPAQNLFKLYVIRSLIVLHIFPIVFGILYRRYKTLRYNFDPEGISMKWGLLFRKKINLTYSRMQITHIHASLL